MKSIKYLLLSLQVLISINAIYLQPLYAPWAHDHLVWINYVDQNQSEIVKMVEGYQSRGIKIGAVNIDSTWTACFNNFEWDLERFPQPQQLIDWLHKQDIKVIVWATSMINTNCSIYKQGVKNKYFLNNGKTIQWWHGTGAFLDYLNPKAIQWWHKQLDKVLDMGIDGFKCDGTDPMIALVRPWPYSPYRKRFVTTTEYSHTYYGDFYNYTKQKNPEGLIMARPTDSFQIYNTSYVFLNYAPKYVMFSGWVGDQDSTFDGFRSAVWNIIHSAWNGYLNFGFDIGGYRSVHNNKLVFIRWAQLGAFVPFMENGGCGKHQPWQFDQDIAKIYKKFVDIHYELKPTFLSYAPIAYANKISVIEPLAKRQSYTITLNYPNTFGYILCQNILVFPIFEPNGVAPIKFPPNSHWFYFFNEKKVFEGGQETLLQFDIDETPVFYRSNSIIGLQKGISVIALEDGRQLNQTFIHKQFTDYIEIVYQDNKFTTKIERYYKDGRECTNQSIKYFFIGFEVSSNSDCQLTEDTNGGKYYEFETSGAWQTINNLRVNYQLSQQLES